MLEVNLKDVFNAFLGVYSRTDSGVDFRMRLRADMRVYLLVDVRIYSAFSIPF